MNPNDIGVDKTVEYDAQCMECGWEGLVEGEAWIPLHDDETYVKWLCPGDCGQPQESFAFVGDLVW